MARIALALGIAAGLALAAGIAPAVAGEPGAEPEQPRPRNFYDAPTDEYVPPVQHHTPRARRDDSSLSALFENGRFDTPPALADKPANSRPVYSYLPALTPAARPSRAPAAPPVYRFTREDFDGAPCPTLSRDSLAALFACTLR